MISIILKIATSPIVVQVLAIGACEKSSAYGQAGKDL